MLLHYRRYQLIEITPRHVSSPVNLLHISRTTFPKNNSGGLLLITENISLVILASTFLNMKSFASSFLGVQRESPMSNSEKSFLKHICLVKLPSHIQRGERFITVVHKKLFMSPPKHTDSQLTTTLDKNPSYFFSGGSQQLTVVKPLFPQISLTCYKYTLIKIFIG